MKIYEIAPIQMFRYKITEYYEEEREFVKRSGYVAGTCYADAVARLEHITTPVKTKEFNECTIVSIDDLYEIDSFDVGVLFDEDIEETFKEEKEKEG